MYIVKHRHCGCCHHKESMVVVNQGTIVINKPSDVYMPVPVLPLVQTRVYPLVSQGVYGYVRY